MLVSIITPNFNSCEFIYTTRQSILGQTHKNWEWLIVDDGSTDDSIDIIKYFSKHDDRIHLLERGYGTKGASTCRNVGIDNAKGEYLIFLDADDLLASHCLELRVKYMKEHPDLDFGVFNMGMFQREIGDVKEVVNLYAEKLGGYLEMFLSYKLPWAITCPLWTTSFLKKNDIRFSEKYSRLQDPEFHSKILLKNDPQFDVFKEMKIDCFYRQPNKSKKGTISVSKTTSSILLYYEEMVDLIKGKHVEDKYNNCLDQFVFNVFHSLLFYSRLEKIAPIINLYKEINYIRPITNLSLKQVVFFARMNQVGLTFIKGAGISRLWTLKNYIR